MPEILLLLDEQSGDEVEFGLGKLIERAHRHFARAHLANERPFLRFDLLFDDRPFSRGAVAVSSAGRG